MSNDVNSFSTTRTLTLAAMLTTISVVIGIICKNFLTFNVFFRFTLENLPVIFAGIVFGPVTGALVGVCADIVSCLCSSNPALNPVITIGAASVGMISGIIPRFVIRRNGLFQMAVTVFTAHLIGQVGIKSIAKILWFGMPYWGIFIGLAFSLIAGLIECLFIKLIITRLNITIKGRNVR